MTPTRREWLAGAAAVAAIPPARSRPLTVMSFNIRVPVDPEPERAWPARRPVVAAMLRHAAPDLIGTQELVRRQAEDIVADLPHYAWFGRDRMGGHDDEHMAILYRRDRLRLVEQGDFWFSDTPDVPGSRHWGNIHPRMTTWGLFARRDTGARFHAFNTHFPYRAEDAPVRLRCAEALLARIAALPVDEPVVLTGDFNTDAADAAHARLASVLADAREGAARVAGPAGTFHGFTGRPEARRIDWIMTRGWRARRYATLTDHRGAVWPSDHFPVVAELA